MAHLVGKLIVRVYRAEGLASADINGKSDPFIKMNLVNQFHRTSTQYKTLNPEWNEMFHFDVKDINNQLELLCYDEDRHGEDFLGRISIPLLNIINKQMVWYQFKDKKLQQCAKGRVLLRLDIEWSVIRASIRTFNPLEELKNPPPPVLRKSLMVSNFLRAKTQIMFIVDVLKYIKSCFNWESTLRSSNAFILFVVITYYFELWMLPFALLMIFSLNYCILSFPNVRSLFNFDETKYNSLVDIRRIMDNDESLTDDSFQTILKNVQSAQESTGGVVSSSSSSSGGSGGTGGGNSSGGVAGSGGAVAAEPEKSIVERIQAGKDVVILVQDITGYIASYLERISNTLTFKVPFLSFLMMFCLTVASLLLYLVPLRYIILIWGVNKFTKKLRNPNYIDNNELVDFLSRIPDNVQCIKLQNIVSY